MTTATHDPEQLRARIQRIYVAATGDEYLTRPLSWLAEQLHVELNTVSRWLMDPGNPNAREPMPPYRREIARLEEAHGLN